MYPEGDPHQPKDAKFTTEPNLSVLMASITHPSSEGVSSTKLRVDQQATNNTPIQVSTGDGFSSDDSEESSPNSTLTSKQKAKTHVITRREESTDSRNSLMRKIVEVPSDKQIAIDNGVQSTDSLSGEGKLKSKRHEGNSLTQRKEAAIKDMRALKEEASWRRFSSPKSTNSPQNSPSRKSNLCPASDVKLRSVSPDVGRRIQSNPFFIQDRDRLSFSNSEVRKNSFGYVTAEKKKVRRESVPAKQSMNATESSVAHRPSSISQLDKVLFKSQSSDFLDVVSPRDLRASSLGSQCSVNEEYKDFRNKKTSSMGRQVSIRVNIQNRIKLWAEKEMNAQQNGEGGKTNGVVSVLKQKEQYTDLKENGVTINENPTLTQEVKVTDNFEITDTSDGEDEQVSKYEHNCLQENVNVVEPLQTQSKVDNDLSTSNSSSLTTPTKNVNSGNAAILDKAVSAKSGKKEIDESIPLTSSSPKTPVRENHSRTSSKDSSSERISDQELTPKRSRWKLRSPRLGRKQNATSEIGSTESVQSDDNTLSNNTKSPKHSTMKKRKDVKKRFSDTISSMFSIESKQEKKSKKNTNVPSENPPDVIPRSNSLGAQSKILVIFDKGRCASEPDIDKVRLKLSKTGRGSQDDEDETRVICSEMLDPETEVFIDTETSGNSDKPEDDIRTMITELEQDSVRKLPSVFVREEKGRGAHIDKERTISTDLRDIIDSFGTVGLNRKDSEIGQEVVLEVATVEGSSQLECYQSPSNSLNVFVEPPADEGVELSLSNAPPRASSPNMLYYSGDSGSDEEGDNDTSQGTELL